MQRVKAAAITAVVSTFEFAMFLSIPVTLMGATALLLVRHQQEIVVFLLR